MTTGNARFGEVDLTSCDREAIHIPGSIQPHGVLLVVDHQDLAIRQFAGDTRFLLGVEPGEVPQLTLFDLFDEQVLLPIVGLLHAPAQTDASSILFGLTSRTGPLPLDATIHAQDGVSVIELESARHGAVPTGNPLSQVRSMLAVLQSADDVEAFCAAAATQVRAATGFDRVMVYQFLHDGSGKVVAENKVDGLEGFLGLHYPASDIPRQARELYRRNWLRLIPDVDYMPAPLEPRETVRTGQPLDMSRCSLRSVSPIHLEYLRNMGVSATMTMSIVMRDQLWGMIACHNYTPRFVATDLRIACELFAQMFSLHLEARIEADSTQRRIASQRIYEALAVRLPAATEIGTALVAGEVTLLDLIPAGGVAVWLDGKLHTLGETPPADFMTELLAWLNGLDQPVVDTFQLGAVLPSAIPFAATASGLLAISLSRRRADYVIWFRPEVVRTVTWAGNPHKPVEVGPLGERLTPRKSFKAWREDVRWQSAPWDGVSIEVAHAFRVWLLETVLRQMDVTRREREAAFAHQSLLMAELDHRVKNTLANIQALVRQTLPGADSLEGFALSLERRIRAMAHAHNLMSATRWQGASVRGLMKEELAPFQQEKTGNIRMSGDDVLLTPTAALPFTLVMHELTSNAAKYGALSTAAGFIDIGWRQDGDGALVVTWKERNGPPVTPPTRRGFGTVIIERSLRHDIKGTSTLAFDPEGVGCVITIPSEHVVPNNPGEAGHV